MPFACFAGWYTIIPAGICHGLTESAAWAGSSVYITYLGEKYSECICRESDIPLRKKKNKESCVYRFFSVFYTFFYLSQVYHQVIFSTRALKQGLLEAC